jgi:hypothetical protein
MKKKGNEIKWYIDIDVSSATLDVSVCVTGQEKDPAYCYKCCLKKDL